MLWTIGRRDRPRRGPACPSPMGRSPCPAQSRNVGRISMYEMILEFTIPDDEVESDPGTRRRKGSRTPASYRVVLELMNGGPLSLRNNTSVSLSASLRSNAFRTCPIP